MRRSSPGVREANAAMRAGSRLYQPRLNQGLDVLVKRTPGPKTETPANLVEGGRVLPGMLA